MVRFILAEGPGRSFPAEDVDAVFDDGGCDPAPGCRKISLARPPIGFRVVFLGHAEVLAVLAVQPAADRAEAAVERGGGMVVAGRRHRRARGPAIGRRVMDLMRAGIAVPVIAAHRYRASRRAPRRPAPRAVWAWSCGPSTDRRPRRTHTGWSHA